MQLVSGEILQNRHRIVTLLRQGGGVDADCHARGLRFEVSIALKEQISQPSLDADMFAQLRQQFKQETVTLAWLSHPNLVKVMDFFGEGGNVYLVMEFLSLTIPPVVGSASRPSLRGFSISATMLATTLSPSSCVFSPTAPRWGIPVPRTSRPG